MDFHRLSMIFIRCWMIYKEFSQIFTDVQRSRRCSQMFASFIHFLSFLWFFKFSTIFTDFLDSHRCSQISTRFRSFRRKAALIFADFLHLPHSCRQLPALPPSKEKIWSRKENKNEHRCSFSFSFLLHIFFPLSKSSASEIAFSDFRRHHSRYINVCWVLISALF